MTMTPDWGESSTEGLVIDCGTCVMRNTDTCAGCVVTFILDRADGAVVFDAAEERAIRAMTGAGLLPLVRYSPDSAAG